MKNMKTRNIVIWLAALLILASSCGKIARNNPFDPDAARTDIFSDNFGDALTPPGQWKYDVFGSVTNFYFFDQMGSIRSTNTVCQVDYALPANEARAIWNLGDSALSGLVFVKFGFTITGAGGASLSRLAFELTADADGTDVKAGFGMFTIDGTVVDFFAESGLGLWEPGLVTASIGDYLTIYVVFDTAAKTMNAWYNEGTGEMTQIVKDFGVPDLTADLKRFQFRVFSDAGGGGPVQGEIDAFSISTL